MYEILVNVVGPLLGEITTDIKTEIGNIISGVSYKKGDTTARVHFYEEPSGAIITSVNSVADTHDPAVITATRDGDFVTVTVSKPRNLDEATTVTLTDNGQSLPNVVTLDVPIEIEDVDGGTMLLSVEGYPCEEVEI